MARQPNAAPNADEAKNPAQPPLPEREGMTAESTQTHDDVNFSGAEDDDDGVQMHNDLHDGHDAEATAERSVHEHEKFPEQWTPPAMLEAPKARPGYVQRWIRMDIRGVRDGRNVAQQHSQGWRPRTLSSVPAGDRHKYPAVNDKRYGTILASGALVLCEMPKRLYDQKRAYYRKKRESQMESVVDQGIVARANAENRNRTRAGIGTIQVVERRTAVSGRGVRHISAAPED